MYETELEVAKEALLYSGGILKNWSKPLNQEWKGSINPVTAADKESEKNIIRILKDSFPSDIIVSEEINPALESNMINKRRWYLDPLDGTVNFFRGLPHWGISLALVESNNVTVCGIVYDPVMNELFYAVKGRGAWCNNIKIKVSATTEMNRAIIASGFPYSFKDIKTSNLQQWSMIVPKVLTARSLGAAAIDICSVAIGRTDIFWEQGLERWDVTAAALICSEAGALVTDMLGVKNEGPGTNIIAANTILHKKVLDIFKELN